MARCDDVRALGRYTLEQPIASGTTATIWRARDTRSGREVAVKRFHAHLFGDRVARKRMDNEAKAARRVHGPTIVSAIDRISTRDEFALVFPFVEGTALSQRMLSQPALTPEASAMIAADVADALTVIHGARMVHRDVKPGNVLLGNDGRARLLDFGISRAVTDDIEAARTMTGAGLAIGTLPYMAPEQLSGQPVTGATDIFALGVVLYELLAGRRPFVASTPVALLAEQRTVPARIDGAPEPLVDLALLALSIDPSARPSASQTSASLRGWLAHPFAADAPTSVISTPGASVTTAPVVGRRRGVATGAALAGALLLIAIVALAAMQPLSGPLPSSSNDPLSEAVAPATTAIPEPSPTGPAASALPSPAATPARPTASTTPSPTPASTSPKPHTGHRLHKHHHNHHRHHHRRRRR